MAERLVSTVLPMGSITGPGSLLPINPETGRKRFRSWLSESEPSRDNPKCCIGTREKICSIPGQVKSFLCAAGFFLKAGLLRSLGHPRKNKARDTLEPKLAAHFPEHSKPWFFRHLGPCDRALSVDSQESTLRWAMPSHPSELQSCP